jgi:hypothetical protein
MEEQAAKYQSITAENPFPETVELGCSLHN